VVVALAIALVVVKDLPNGGGDQRNQVPSAAPADVPRYFVALKQLAGNAYAPTQRSDIVVGDSRTGQTVATIAPPARTAFESVTAAADDRTFVIFGLTSSTGTFTGSGKDVLTGNWYALRLTPGTAHPAQLTRLPVKPQTVSVSVSAAAAKFNPGVSAFIASFSTVVSPSGQEIAVPEWTAPNGGLAVKVFSVATGRLLHQWTASAATHLAEQPTLAWVDGGRQLALVSRMTLFPGKSDSTVEDVTVRQWPAAGPASGDLVADSKVVWEVKTTGGPMTTVQQCVEPVVGGPVVISPDGQAFSCPTAGGWGTVDHLSFHTYPLAASTTATAKGTIDYQVTFTRHGLYVPDILWTSRSGDTLVGALIPITEESGGAAGAPDGLRIGVISDGKFTPLRVPESLAKAGLTDITF
jgi:hypothetical protein